MLLVSLSVTALFRLLLLSLTFAIELVLLSLSVDGQSLVALSGSGTHLLAKWGSPLLHFLVSFTALGATFTYLRRRTALAAFEQAVSRTPLNLIPVALHLLLFVGLMTVGQRLYSGSGQHESLVYLFLALGVSVLLSGLASVAPLPVWAKLIKSVGLVWAYAAAAASAAVLMTAGWRTLWLPASQLTYAMVQLLLRPFLGQLIVEPDRFRIATGRFGVIISPECSGLEGIGLLLLFGLVWLWLYRKECQFPQALLLLPVGVVTLFVLNSIRIATLILIGHAGARQIAIQGFHSQAGWIAFNGVAFGLCIVAGRMPWIAKPRSDSQESPAAVNIVAVYLGPFLAILAAGMLARAFSARFEWLYPLRVIAASIALWYYRREYRKLDWRFTWRGPVIGLFVFGLWILLEWLLSGLNITPMPDALRTASDPARWAWLLLRVCGAVVLVPIAEELAFRGYLIRRLSAEQFDELAPSHFTLWTLVGSSLLFGAMHGGRWLAAAAAGCLYALVYVRRGQIGEAVTAHAVTNALIAAAVLLLNLWTLW